MTLRFSWLALALAFVVALPAAAQTRLAAPSFVPAEARAGGDDFPTYTAILSGANEVPPSTSAGGGYAFANLLPDGSFTTFALVSGLTGPVQAAHIHQGAPGVNGPVILPASDMITFDGQTQIAFTGTLTADQQAALAAGNLYVNVHTAAFPGGEVRGQLRAAQSIESARTAGVGAVVSVFAYVLRAEGAFTYLTDETGGLTVRQTSGEWFDAVASGEITTGTVVRVTGTLSEFRGLLQINQPSAPAPNDLASFEIGTDVGFNVNETAARVTLEDIATSGEDLEARLVVVTDVTIDATGVFAPSTNYTVTDGSTPPNPVLLRVPGANDTAVDGLGIPTGPTTVLGIVGQFTTTEPNIGYQILPIEAYDIAPTAGVQVIHNAPDPTLATVDVFVNGALALDDVAFRTATGSVALPAYADAEIDVRDNAGTLLFSTLFFGDALAPGGGTIKIVALGVADPAMFAANPDGVPTDFALGLYQPSRQRGPALVGTLAVHGAPDAPAIDLRAGSTVLVDDLFYTDGLPFAAPASATVLTVTTADGTFVANFAADFTALAGQSATVLASGFLSPAANQNGPLLALLVVAEDGTTTVLEGSFVATADAPSAALVLGVAPNPVVGAATVTLALPAAEAATVEVFDALGRRVATLASGDQPAGTTRLAVPSLAPGVYVVRATTATERATTTLTVVR